METTYERPTNVVENLQQRLAAIKGEHLTQTVEHLMACYHQAANEELDAMRRAYDVGRAPEFWLCEGYRLLTAAHEHEWRLATFKKELETCAYVRAGHGCMSTTWLVYVWDHTSPTAVRLTTSCKFGPESDALVIAHQKCPTEKCAAAGGVWGTPVMKTCIWCGRVGRKCFRLWDGRPECTAIWSCARRARTTKPVAGTSSAKKVESDFYPET